MLDQAEKLRKMASNSLKVSKPKVITITSGKGGVGKSNIVVNLGIALQKMGKKVMIFDADIGMGNDDVLMGFLPKYNVFDIIYRDKEINDVVINGPFGVKLLPAGSGVNQIEDLTEEQREKFLKKIQCVDDVDYIFMDTGAGINRSVLAFAACAEELIIVTTPEPTSLTDAYSLLKAVSYFKLKSKANVIVNRALDYKEGEVTYKKFESAAKNFLKMELNFLGAVLDDRKVTQAVRNQTPFLINYPGCNASHDINNIANNILGNNDEIKGIGVQGLFKKIFSIFS